MTQKELLYVEDAIGHEKNIVSILNETISYIENEELVTFLEKEEEKHQTLQDKLMNMLKEKSNE